VKAAVTLKPTLVLPPVLLTALVILLPIVAVVTLFQFPLVVVAPKSNRTFMVPPPLAGLTVTLRSSDWLNTPSLAVRRKT
jgi:hypothetical protein